ADARHRLPVAGLPHADGRGARRAGAHLQGGSALGWPGLHRPGHRDRRARNAGTPAGERARFRRGFRPALRGARAHDRLPRPPPSLCAATAARADRRGRRGADAAPPRRRYRGARLAARRGRGNADRAPAAAGLSRAGVLQTKNAGHGAGVLRRPAGTRTHPRRQDQAAREARLRSLSVSSFLRRRISFGVTSTSSSSSMKSSACSRVNFSAGVSLIASSLPEARMLVSGLVLIALTVRSLSLEWMPVSWPSYTRSPSASNRRQRSSCRPRASAGVRPATLAIHTRFGRVAMSPCSFGPEWSNTWKSRPEPWVRVLNSFLKPIRPRA